MTDFSKVIENLKQRGYEVLFFENGEEAAEYLNECIDGKTVGIGGSATIESIGLYQMLSEHNDVTWHWKQDADMARKKSMTSEIYLTSVNALAETGEMVNIDGVGNRISATLFGHQEVYFVIGRNKLVETYEDAIHRARNVAAPGRAKQLKKNTPCAVKADKCYDCKSPDRICNGMTVLWGPMTGMKGKVVLIDEELGL